jgi:hypothetical protein
MAWRLKFTRPRPNTRGDSGTIQGRIDRGALPGGMPMMFELRAEMAAALDRADELREGNRELHFEIDRRGRLRIEVRDLDGRVIRAIGATEMLDVLAGARLED